jgi:hypothetical protein
MSAPTAAVDDGQGLLGQAPVHVKNRQQTSKSMIDARTAHHAPTARTPLERIGCDLHATVKSAPIQFVLWNGFRLPSMDGHLLQVSGRSRWTDGWRL